MHAYDSSVWEKATEIYIRKDNSITRGDIFINTFTGVTKPDGCTMDTWCTVDLSELVPKSAISVFLSGILIITHGTSLETADLNISFRSIENDELCPTPQTPECVQYIGQAVEATVGNGQRSNMATWVPVKNGKFQFRYHTSTGGGIQYIVAMGSI